MAMFNLLISRCLFNHISPLDWRQAPQTVEALSKEANETAHIIGTNAEPIAEAFVDQQLKPRAHEFASELEPQVLLLLVVTQSKFCLWTPLLFLAGQLRMLDCKCLGSQMSVDLSIAPSHFGSHNQTT